jgi:hypothetical protein
MREQTVSSEIDKAYADLKAALIQKDLRITFEEVPKRILVKQGSLWGLSPKTAKKTIDFNFVSVGSETRVKWYSRINSDWKGLTLVGCVLAAAMVGLCVWMSLDLTTFMIERKASFWSWLVAVNGDVDLQVGQAFVNLTRVLAAFLSAVILFEIADVVYVHAGIEKFAQEIMNSFSR